MKYTDTIRRINKEYLKLQKNEIPNIVAKPNPSNIFEWHFAIHNLQDTVFSGIYHGKLILPTEYPQKPPSIKFVTPNGRFKQDESICLSFTNYHPESWSAAWDISKMLLAMVSFMMTEEATTGMIRSSHSQRLKYAKFSTLYNLKNPEFVKIFKDKFKILGIDPQIVSSPESLQNYENQLVQQLGNAPTGEESAFGFNQQQTFFIVI